MYGQSVKEFMSKYEWGFGGICPGSVGGSSYFRRVLTVWNKIHVLDPRYWDLCILTLAAKAVPDFFKWRVST